MEPAIPASPPKAPNPSQDGALKPQETSPPCQQTDLPLVLQSADWDICSVTATSALKMLIEAVQALSTATGVIPPTPPASRPTTPKASSYRDSDGHPGFSAAAAAPSPTSPTSPDSPVGGSTPSFPPITLPSPEAHRNEHIPDVEVGAEAETVALQRAAISRRFFVKTEPPFSLSDYLLRLHNYCPHSPGVYLAASAYIHRLCVQDVSVPATTKTIHRLSLTAIRVASKALEDNKWRQERFANVGGINRRELKSLEVNLCFLLDFELFVRPEDMARRMYLLQQAARQGMNIRKRLSEGFRMKLPMRLRPEAD